MSRFASPLTRTLQLSQPPGQAFADTLVVRRRLTSGEARDVWTRMWCVAYLRRLEAAARSGLLTDPTIDEATRERALTPSAQEVFGLHRRSLCAAYLIDWSFVDDQGQKIGIAGQAPATIEQVLDALEPEDFLEVYEAVATHESEMQAERDAEKKTRTGVTPLPAISPSPDAATGAMTGSPSSTLM